MAALHLRIPDKLEQDLNNYAKKHDRSKSYLVRKAIENYLIELQENIEDYDDALKALKDDSPRITWEEIQRTNVLI